jgi:hypothetical protein
MLCLLYCCFTAALLLLYCCFTCFTAHDLPALLLLCLLVLLKRMLYLS